MSSSVPLSYIYVICLLPAGISLSFNKVTCEFISKYIPRPSYNPYTYNPHLLLIFVWLMPYSRYIITNRLFGMTAFMAAPMILYGRRLLYVPSGLTFVILGGLPDAFLALVSNANLIYRLPFFNTFSTFHNIRPSFRVETIGKYDTILLKLDA